MNTGPADTRSPHLDLADLIAEVTGQTVADQARDHLARCEHCRAEANRWDRVADGIRGLAAATPEVAPPARARPTRPRVLASHRRRTWLAASAAAALVVLAAAGYGVTAALTRNPPSTALTAVSGCAGFEVATGTLEQVTGSRLVIKTASGQPVTVTTTASTRVSMAGALRSDITDGAPVIVLGPRSGGTVAAATLTVGRLPGAKGVPKVTPPPGWVAVWGTVADAGSAGFTVITPGGTRVPVTTSQGTFVVVPGARLGQLQAGVTTAAVGRARPGRTLSAIGVVQQPPGSQFRVQFHAPVSGCSPGTLAAALNAALVPGG
jgi:predicted anti-sigma-YlaC factor YlaD